MKMIEELDKIAIGKLLRELRDSVLCLECCKYLSSPEVASCGHTLCRVCWQSYNKCPYCSKAIEKKTLRSNKIEKQRVNHIHKLCNAFENIIDAKFDEYMLNVSIEGINSKNKESKNVKDWLADSQNHFSMPPTNSEQTEIILHNVSTSKAQIHSNTEKKLTLNPKNVYVSMPQDDFDKIEIMPDSEDFTPKNKENIIGPLDIEPFSLDDVYTNKKPRRSARKKEPNLNTLSSIVDNSLRIQNTPDLNATKSEKKLHKLRNDWNTVKKMKKEFNKFTKPNKSKLNLSIKTCEKTSNTKSAIAETVLLPEMNNSNNDSNLDSVKNKEIIPISQEILKINKDNCKNSEVSLNVKGSDDDFRETTSLKHVTSLTNIEQPSPEYDDSVKSIKKALVKENEIKDNSQQSNGTSKINSLAHEITPSNKTQNVAFFKKGALCKDRTYDGQKSSSTNIELLSEDADDILITVKIGTISTNITVKRKENATHLKINTDREIQTSLDPNLDSGIIDERTNMQSSTDCAINKNKRSMLIPQSSDNKIDKSKHILLKSIASKRHTDSDDTTIAHFEITESVAKQFSDVMEHIEENALQKNDTGISKNPKLNMQAPKIIIEDLNNIVHEDEIQDLDIFDGGEGITERSCNNKTQHTSEILGCTMKQKNTCINSKRNREISNDDLFYNKKIKLTNQSQQNSGIQKSLPRPEDSQHISYDTVMGKVFASIDADMNSEKTATEKTNSNKTLEYLNELNPNIQSHSQRTKNFSSHNVVPEENVDMDSKDYPKCSENVFSLLDKDGDSALTISKSDKQITRNKTPKDTKTLLTSRICEGLVAPEVEECVINTPLEEFNDSDGVLEEFDDSDSVLEDTPQKNPRPLRSKTDTNKTTDNNMDTTVVSKCKSMQSNAINDIKKTASSDPIKMKDVTLIEITNTLSNTIKAVETPLTVNKFDIGVRCRSTPVAKKSLSFVNHTELEKSDTDPDQTLCQTTCIAKTTQEKQLMLNAFEPTPLSPVLLPESMKNTRIQNKSFCIAASCLSPDEIDKIKILCFKNKWKYVDKYTKEITHLVVQVDEERKCQRSVKYMCSVAAGKWIVTFVWIEKCLEYSYVPEDPYEVLDFAGEPGPRRSRLSKRKLFEGFTFYCMSPFSVLDNDTLKIMLESAGGRVVSTPSEVRAADCPGPALLLAEPEHTQQSSYTYFVIEMGIVPVNYEWVLNCLGSYTLISIHELLLCPIPLLPPATSKWPASILADEF